MADTLLSIMSIALTATEWTPLQVYGLIAKIWINYSADIKMRSDPSDAMTEQTLQVSNGNQYVITLPRIINVTVPKPLIYLQAVSDTTTVMSTIVRGA